MRLLSWNVNGLRAAVRNGFLDLFKKEDFDILGIQETKLQADQIPDEVHAPGGYKTWWAHAERKGYSGVALFSKREPLAVNEGWGDSRFDGEGRVLAAEFKDFHLFNVYFPNGQKDAERLKYKLDFYASFFEHVRTLSEHKPVIICGDFNTAHKEIDLANPEENSDYSGFLPEERAWLDKFVGMGFVDTFRLQYPDRTAYSWWTYRFKARERNIGWRIDYFFVSRGLATRIKDAFILPDIQGSDHCPVGLELDI